MYIAKNSSSGTTLIPIETALLEKRVVFLEGEINEKSAHDFICQLMYLHSLDKTSPISVLIDSCGGQFKYGMKIYDAIQENNVPVNTFCNEMAYSMAAVLFASGKHRYMLPNSEVMIHEPMIQDMTGGNSTAVRSISDHLQDTKMKMINILAKHTGKTEQEIEEAISYDHYFNAEESAKFGLCDEIITFGKMMEVIYG